MRMHAHKHIHIKKKHFTLLKLWMICNAYSVQGTNVTVAPITEKSKIGGSSFCPAYKRAWNMRFMKSISIKENEFAST